MLFAALLLGTFVFLWQKTRPVKVVYTIVQPKLDTLKQFVVATGKVEPRDEVLIKPQISGIVSDVYKEAGQMVRKGEVIATVKVVPEMGQLSSAESRVSVAEISLAQTRREFGRTETLHDKGVVSDEEFEQGRTDLQKAEEELQNAKENLEIVKNGITSRYCGLDGTLEVREGDTVQTGQKLGVTGANPDLESAAEPHLHLEVKKRRRLCRPDSILWITTKRDDVSTVPFTYIMTLVQHALPADTSRSESHRDTFSLPLASVSAH